MGYIIYLFYRYYNKGATRNISYESALFAVLMLLYINVLSIGILLAPEETTMLFSNLTRGEKYIYSMIGVIIGYFFLSRIIPKKKILKMEALSKNIKLHGRMLGSYVIISFLFLMFLIVRSQN